MKEVILAVSIAAVLTIGAALFAPVIASDSWAAKYTGHLDSYRWEATITNQSVGVYNLHLSVASRMPECSGDVLASAKLVGDKLLIDDEDCTLTVSRRRPNGLRIDER